MKKNKTWAYGILFSLLIFAGLMTSFAIIASRHTENLVVKDYYKEEIAFQKQIEKIKNTNALTEKPDISVDSCNNVLKIHMPTAGAGSISFYRPDDDSKDFKMPIEQDTDGWQTISLTRFEKGAWTLKLDWTSAGKSYYFEKKLTLYSIRNS